MRIISLLAISTLLVACGSQETKDLVDQRQKDINECIQKGYSYYDSLGYGKGNYKLYNGRMRDDEVRIRCERQPRSAFG